MSHKSAECAGPRCMHKYAHSHVALYRQASDSLFFIYRVLELYLGRGVSRGGAQGAGAPPSALEIPLLPSQRSKLISTTIATNHYL